MSDNPKCPFCGETMCDTGCCTAGLELYFCNNGKCAFISSATKQYVEQIAAALAQHDAQKAEPVKDERFEKLFQAVYALHADVFMGFLMARSESKAEKAYHDISKKLDNLLHEASK